MTEPIGQRPGGPKHARQSRFGGGRTALVLGVVVAIVLAAGVVTWLVRSNNSDSAASQTANRTILRAADSPTTNASITGSGAVAGSAGQAAGGSSSAQESTAAQCPDGVLRVAADPDIADVVADIGAVLVDPDCRVEVKSMEPAEVVAGGAAGIDLWIPDSSMWIDRAEAAGVAVQQADESVATSPVVFALSPTAAAGLGAGSAAPDLKSILSTRQTATPIRVGLPDPARSASAVGAILAARAAVAGTTDARAALTWAVRSSPAGLPSSGAELLDRLAAEPGVAVPVSEQAVIAHNAAEPDSQAVAVYPGTAGVALDYPAVILADSADAAAAADLVALLVGEQGRTALLDNGFRAPDGTPGPLMAASTGVNATVRVTAPLPSTAEVDDAIRQLQISNEPSRMLALMDVSGSMQARVPGAGGADRMTLAKEAASRGLSLYPADSAIGLWEFSTNLSPTADHRELVPVVSLGPDGQGSSGAQRLAQALGAIRAIPNGGTGLYDTVLDAVRTMRASWDPNKVNAVLLLTDGMNDDANGISLETLLGTLAAEQDPAKPVPVISIAFGPDSDVQSLGQISRATGGAAYISLDPRQIGEIFLDAVGQRLCRPSC